MGKKEPSVLGNIVRALGIGLLIVWFFSLLFDGLKPMHAPRPMSVESQPASVTRGSVPIQDTLLKVSKPVQVAAPAVVQSAPEPPLPPAKKEITVYTTKTGDHYHRAGCSSLRRSSYATSLSDALASGYEACHRCRPAR